MNYNKRIGDDFLRADHVDGEVLQHTELNELENVVKVAVNANYTDIQKLQNGVLVAKNSEELGGATLSPLEDETLQNSDTKVPTSAQVKSYVDTQNNTKQDTLVSGTNIKTINNQSLLGNGNLDVTGLKELSSIIEISSLADGIYRLPNSCLVKVNGVSEFSTKRGALLSVSHVTVHGKDTVSYWAIEDGTYISWNSDLNQLEQESYRVILHRGAVCVATGQAWSTTPHYL